MNAPDPVPPPVKRLDPTGGKVLDLMEALKESLAKEARRKAMETLAPELRAAIDALEAPLTEEEMKIPGGSMRECVEFIIRSRAAAFRLALGVTLEKK